ncbi:hypothetical protein Tco_0992039 [Tanacetum coccineum]|uniref:Retrotransposon gag domain-containing protein n=1 Tax=Tanacetum coccineum TaxID=301880 RepID=A0ABQ5F2A9_9ASTR
MTPSIRSLVTPVNNTVNNGASGTGNNTVVDDNVRQLLSELVDVRFNRMQESIDALTNVSSFLPLIIEAEKVQIVSILLHDKSLLWHTQFIKSQGGYASWETYKQAVLARFGTVYDDPISELKNLKYETITRVYQDAFDDLLSRGGSDMVLGIQWLSLLGDIKCNFKDLRMEFVYKNKKCAKISLMRMEGTSPDLQPELQSVVEEFDDVFAIPKELPLKAIENMVQEILDTGVIRQSNSPFAFPIVMVKKKYNTWRMCVDYRQLNKNTIKDKFPIPIIEELIDELRESQIFSKLDLR